MAPLGATPTATTPTLVASMPQNTATLGSTGAQVDYWDEETYICKPDDTFARISGKLYNSTIYDRALLLFNRQHPRAADSLRQEPPLLQVGQPLYIPPLRILQKRYAAVIPEAPAAVPAGGIAPATGNLPPPPAAVSTSGASPVTTGAPPAAGSPSTPIPAPTASAGGAKTYKVRPEGEKVSDIAQTTLGKVERWIEIYGLNPNVNFNLEKIPGGTELRLPPDAQVDAAPAR